MNIEGQTHANTAVSPECAPLLEIEDLHVSVPAQNGRKFVISGLTLSVNAGKSSLSSANPDLARA